MPAPTAASVDTSIVRDRFNFDWATNPDNGFDGDTYWWWARSVRIDPNEIIADDDEGNLYSVPFQTDGKDEITFGEPVKVREDYVPVAASVGAQVERLQRRHGQKADAFSRPTKPDETTAASSAAENKENDMPNLDMDALRSHLGLDEDASEEQINAALSAEPEGSGESGDDPEPEGEPKGTEQTPEPVAASADSPTMTVDRGAFEELQRQAREGAEARAEQVRQEREATLSAAVKAGKIAPASREAWAAKLSAEPEATKAELEALPEGLVPVEETGAAGDPTALSADAYPDHWLPELKAQRAGAVTTE